MIRNFKYFVTLVLVSIVSSCSIFVPASETSSIGYGGTAQLFSSPEAGMGIIIGRVENAYEIWPEKDLFVFAAHFHGGSEGDGSFILEPDVFPKATLNSNGNFQINNMPPRQYVLLIGPTPESALFIEKEEKIQVVEILADEIVDLGIMRLNP